ncbi:hypothetical protein F511_12908 [Dorcoceras hygrometricum]|uniref:Delphilin-like n=1 Tax=Dorcoceras hygrometricum TaxID=472368 RepID=A0A2Z7CEG8_9LAMI|nr:hypothetical protein F511_12908 [Dorcoceras hygrometricum]
MKTNSNKKFSRRNDRKVLMAEESTKSWADSDSETSSTSSSSSDSEQEEVHCFMADQTDDDEVFDFANSEFTREDLVQALNDMVHEYKTLSHIFEEIKAENASLKNSSAESRGTATLASALPLKYYPSRKQHCLRHSISSYSKETDLLTHSLHSQMASAFITYSYQINFESVLMIHDHEGMLNMFKALEDSGLRRFLGCESVLYETELGHFFDTALIQDEDITCVISGKFVTISPTLFAMVFDLPSEGITNLSEVPKDKVYDARSLFSQKDGQIDVHGKKKYMKHEFRLLNDILAKAITVKAGSFDSVTVERFQMMTAIQYGLKVNWGKVLFNVLKDMVDRSQRKAKGFAAQIGFLLNGIPTVNMGGGVPFPSAKILSMRIVHTYIVTNTTIDARTENEEPGMAKTAVEKKTPKAKKNTSSADEMSVDIFGELTTSKKRSTTEADAPLITKKRRTGKSKPSVSQVNLNIVQDLSRDSDDESVGTEEIIKEADAAVVISTVEVDIAKVLEDTLALGVTATERESQGVDEALFEEDFARWLDDFVARHNEPELVITNNEAQAAGSINSVVDKEIRLGEFLNFGDLYSASLPRISSLDKGKGILVEDEQVRVNPAREIVELICTDVAFIVSLRDQIMVDVENFFHSFSINKLTNFDALLELKEKEKFMLVWAATDSLEMAVKRKMYIIAQYKAQLLRMIMESHRQFCIPGQHWTTTASEIFDLLSDAHSKSLEDLLAQQRELGLSMDQPCPSSIVDSSVDSGATLARCYSIATYTCWVRPVILINGAWTPIQGPNFWSSSCHLSLFLNKKTVPAHAFQEIFVPNASFIEPIQYWTTVQWLMRIWRWTKVCEEIVQFNMVGGLRPVRKDICQDIIVFNLGVERIPADFHRVFARGLASHNFVDSVVEKDLGDIEEVVLTDVEEVDLISSDVSTVYRSPSPLSPGVDSLEHDLRFALGPTIFSRVEQEERLYFVQSPESPPAVSPHYASSSSSTDVSLHFDSTDVPMHAQTVTQAPASVDFNKFTEALEDLRSSLAQRIHDSNCEMLSKLNAVELGVRGDLLKMQSLLRQSFETACRVLERQGNTHTAQITDLKKGLMAPVGTIFGDLFDIKKNQREQDARLITMDEQIAAIRNEHLDFQSKIAADILSISTQVGDIADFLRGGAAKKGEMGSSSRPTTVRAQTQTLPPTTGTFEERVAQARRHIIETGQVISIEEAAARVIEGDRRESERLERERRERSKAGVVLTK